MLDLGKDLADFVLAPVDDSPLLLASAARDSLERFVEGLCRTVGAGAACIMLPSDGDASVAIGRVASSEAAGRALQILLGTERLGSRCGYRWISIQQHAEHCGLMVDLPGATRGGHLLLAFSRGYLDDEGVIAQVLTLAPSLALMAGAVQSITAHLHTCERRVAALEAVLNQSECGIVVVAMDHSVIFANATARAILDRGDGIELRRNMLRPTRYQDAVRLHAILDAVITPSRHMAARRPRGAMLLLERPGPERPLIAVVAPVDQDWSNAIAAQADASTDLRDDRQQDRAAAIVRVMCPETEEVRGMDTICQLHGLSPVETQLVGCLTSRLTLSEAASRMRIKPDTARTYLKQIFAKTDTHRQSDLIQLFLRYQRAVSGYVLFEAA